MIKRGALLQVVQSILFVACAAACDKPSDSASSASAASASAATSATPPTSAPAVSAVAPLASGAAAPSASAAPSAAPAAEATSDVTVTVRDPVTESQKSVKALVGGSVTVYLPEYPGTTWTWENPDRGLGKPKEEIIPGFAGPATPGHQFAFSTKSPMLKKGQTHKVQLVNKKANKPTGTSFTLTIDLA